MREGKWGEAGIGGALGSSVVRSYVSVYDNDLCVILFFPIYLSDLFLVYALGYTPARFFSAVDGGGGLEAYLSRMAVVTITA